MLNTKYLIHNTTYRGFSILEVMISMFIFVLVAMAASMAFSGAIKNQKVAHEKQQDLENLRTAIELIAKTMRMSTKVEPSGTGKTIYMYNYSESRCVSFNIDTVDGKLKGAYYSSVTDPDDCDLPAVIALYDYSQITSVGIEDGKFDIVSSDSDTVGRAIIMLKAGNDTMQTSVSFRDFEAVNPN